MTSDDVTQPDDVGDERARADEPLTALRAELETVESVPIDDRVALFERANATIARELAQLDEV